MRLDPEQVLDLGNLLIRRRDFVAAWEEHYNGVHTWVKLSGGTCRDVSMPLQEVRRIVFGKHMPVYFATSVCTEGLELKETL